VEFGADKVQKEGGFEQEGDERRKSFGYNSGAEDLVRDIPPLNSLCTQPGL
jgi:hypothetical protein